MIELAPGRVPALADAGIKSLTNGPESFTPDGNFILGEAPLTVYETLMQAGKESGLINAGYRVIETCRLEKGYRKHRIHQQWQIPAGSRNRAC